MRGSRACLAARYAAEAQERLDDLERAHKDKFAFDYGRRDDLAALTMQARANEAKVKAYSEDVPPPEPAPLGDGWSSDSTEELIEMPQIEEIVDNESLQEALRRKRLEYVRRCRSDVAFLEELDDCVQDRLDDFGDERGHGVEAEVSFSSRLLDVFRAPRIKFVRNGIDLKLEAKSILREEVARLYARPTPSAPTGTWPWGDGQRLRAEACDLKPKAGAGRGLAKGAPVVIEELSRTASGAVAWRAWRAARTTPPAWTSTSASTTRSRSGRSCRSSWSRRETTSRRSRRRGGRGPTSRRALQLRRGAYSDSSTARGSRESCSPPKWRPRPR